MVKSSRIGLCRAALSGPSWAQQPRVCAHHSSWARLSWENPGSVPSSLAGGEITLFSSAHPSAFSGNIGEIPCFQGGEGLCRGGHWCVRGISCRGAPGRGAPWQCWGLTPGTAPGEPVPPVQGIWAEERGMLDSELGCLLHCWDKLCVEAPGPGRARG